MPKRRQIYLYAETRGRRQAEEDRGFSEGTMPHFPHFPFADHPLGKTKISQGSSCRVSCCGLPIVASRFFKCFVLAPFHREVPYPESYGRLSQNGDWR